MASGVKFINRVQFFRRCKGRYWKNQRKRWEYMGEAIRIISSKNVSKILEIGNCGISLSSVSETMDIIRAFYPNGLKYLHSATDIPWPIGDKEYDFSVALQVFEHLDDLRIKQINVFDEMRRVSKNIIISVPFMWKFNKLSNHANIDDTVVFEWSSGRLWNYSKIFGDLRKRKLYYWQNV